MTAQATPRHGVSAATAQMRAAADAVVDASVWSMDAAETASTLVELTRLEAQVAELEARVAAHADELHVGQDVAASSAANWLAHRTRQTRSEANRTVRLVSARVWRVWWASQFAALLAPTSWPRWRSSACAATRASSSANRARALESDCRVAAVSAGSIDHTDAPRTSSSSACTCAVATDTRCLGVAIAVMVLAKH